MNELSKISVVLPSLDPDEKLAAVIDGLLEYGFTDIILVNDGSKPENLHYFEDAAAQHPEIHLLHHPVNRGKGAALRKTGEGVLALSGAHRFAGTVEVAGGTLRIPARKIPSAIPCEPFFVIDASRRSTYEEHVRAESGTNFVDLIHSAVAVNYRSMNPSPLCAVREDGYKAPFLVEDVFASVGGKSAPAFDFWDKTPNGNSVNAGGFWRIAYSNAPSSFPAVRGVTTMIALVKPRFSGGTNLLVELTSWSPMYTAPSALSPSCFKV